MDRRAVFYHPLFYHKEKSISRVPWPSFDENTMKQDLIHIVIQVNGKLRAECDIPADADEAHVKIIVLANEKIQSILKGQSLRRFIYVPGRLASIVV